MSQSAFINQIASELVSNLEGQTNEKKIRELTLNSWKQLRNEITSEGSINRARTTLRKSVESAFPHSDDVKPGYYFTTTGKGKEERYEHLALWYLTTNEERWQIVGDEARKQYWANLPELPKPEKQPEAIAKTAQPKKSTPKAKPQGLEAMTIDQLGLDGETQQIVKNAIVISGISFADFIREACKIHAKTITGKAKQLNQDLAGVSTKDLLTNKVYSTHPGRAEELVKRAIKAVKKYNSEIATECNQRWVITQSLIASITGSRPAKVGEVLKQFQTEINDHNAALATNCGIEEKQIPYWNRKGVKPEETIDFAALVPTGLDE